MSSRDSIPYDSPDEQPEDTFLDASGLADNEHVSWLYESVKGDHHEGNGLDIWPVPQADDSGEIDPADFRFVVRSVIAATYERGLDMLDYNLMNLREAFTAAGEPAEEFDGWVVEFAAEKRREHEADADHMTFLIEERVIPATAEGDEIILAADSSPAEVEQTAEVPESSSSNLQGAMSLFNAGDVEAYLNGDLETPVPGIAALPGGEGMFYPGKYHEIHAQPERMKSAFGQWGVAQALSNTDGLVIAIDFESDQAEYFKRVVQAGADKEEMRSRFQYFAPDIHMPDLPAAFDAITAQENITFVVLDGFNAGLSMMNGASSDSQEDVNRWIRSIVHPFKKAGAAVLAVDHVPKDSNANPRYPVGAQAKYAAIDGVSFTIEPKPNMKPDGDLSVFQVVVCKDRHNQVKSAGSYEHKEPGLSLIGDLVFQGRGEGARIEMVEYLPKSRPKVTLPLERITTADEIMETEGKLSAAAMALVLVHAFGGTDGISRDEVEERWQTLAPAHYADGKNARRKFDELRAKKRIKGVTPRSKNMVVSETALAEFTPQMNRMVQVFRP